MSIKIKGNVYYLVDVVFDEDMIYDIYEDRNGNMIKLPSGVIE